MEGLFTEKEDGTSSLDRTEGERLYFICVIFTQGLGGKGGSL